MKHKPFLLIVIMSVSIFACSQQFAFPPGRWVDLSYEYSDETVFWPTVEPFKLEVVADGMTEAGYYYAANTFSTAEHGGTHLDAPVHFARGGWSTEQVPLENLIGPAVVIDVTEKSIADRDYLITIDDITSWEARHGVIPSNSILFFRTGFGRYWPDAAQYLGTENRGEDAVAELHFPGISPEAAQWLVDNRTVNAIGIDTASIDYGQSTMFETHRIIYPANIPGFENVANLDQLPETGALIVALPMKIKGGTGGPLRIVALIPN